MKKRKLRIEIYVDKRDEWRWRLKATNGRILADSGEGYKRKASLDKVLLKIFSIDQVEIWWEE